MRRGTPAALADRLENGLVLVLGVTIAGGLGLLIGGARPGEMLHLVYAIVALGMLPTANHLARRADPRGRGAAGFIGGLITAVVILRLFQTG
ncbi:MAG TPA: hypothetical protein VIM30_01900 [Candidatus Limnocylindrales bacterium]